MSIIGSDERKHYADLTEVLGLSQIIHIPYSKKLGKVYRDIHKALRESQLVIALSFKRYEFEVYIRQILKEYPQPLVHTMGSDGTTHIPESLYIKLESLEKIFQQHSGEI